MGLGLTVNAHPFWCLGVRCMLWAQTSTEAFDSTGVCGLQTFRQHIPTGPYTQIVCVCIYIYIYIHTYLGPKVGFGGYCRVLNGCCIATWACWVPSVPVDPRRWLRLEGSGCIHGVIWECLKKIPI